MSNSEFSISRSRVSGTRQIVETSDYQRQHFIVSEAKVTNLKTKVTNLIFNLVMFLGKLIIATMKDGVTVNHNEV